MCRFMMLRILGYCFFGTHGMPVSFILCLCMDECYLVIICRNVCALCKMSHKNFEISHKSFPIKIFKKSCWNAVMLARYQSLPSWEVTNFVNGLSVIVVGSGCKKEWMNEGASSVRRCAYRRHLTFQGTAREVPLTSPMWQCQSSYIRKILLIYG